MAMRLWLTCWETGERVVVKMTAMLAIPSRAPLLRVNWLSRASRRAPAKSTGPPPPVTYCNELMALLSWLRSWPCEETKKHIRTETEKHVVIQCFLVYS